MKILIVDDERLARLRLKSLIEEMGSDFEVVAQAENGLEALKKWQETLADVLLLDIRMPEMDGLDVAREIVKNSYPVAVIFTTAYGEHALQAFDENAIDYLVKPVRKDRLLYALQKAHVFSQAKWEGVDSLMENKARSHICVQIKSDLHLIALKDIYFFQAEQKYVTLKTRKKEYLLDEPLKSLEHEFSGLFIRIHRNALVSLLHIEDLLKKAESRWEVSFIDLDVQLPVSRRLVVQVRACLKEFNVSGSLLTHD